VRVLSSVPAYFAYILRAFSVLEGIGLAADPQFSIASACFPYIARRLLSDPHPQAEAVLEGILYGPRGRDAPLDTHRVRQLATAFRSFGDVTKPVSDQTAASPLGADAKEAIRLALSPQGGPLQRVLLRELAKVAASAAAVGAQAVATTLPGRFAAAAMDAQRAAVYQAVGSARWMAAPLTLPADMLAFAAPLMRATPEDGQRLEAARAVVDVLFESSKVNNGEEQQKPEEVADRVRAWLTAAAPMLPELAPGLAAATLRFGSICLEQAAGRIAAADKEDRATGGDGLGAPPRV
jgi:aarF domain-containing kinase